MTSCLIGIDIGTQGTKTALYDIKGNLLAESFEKSVLISTYPGHVEEDPEVIFNSVINTIREVMDTSGVDPSYIKGIGLDGQMAGIIGINKNWDALTPYDSWLDTRCSKYIKLMKDKADNLITKTSGSPVSCNHAPKILWWKNEKPAIYKSIKKFVMLTTYVAGKLTGLKSDRAYIDYTHLHFSGFGDIENLEWSSILLDMFSVEKSKMPDIVEPWKIIGGLKAEIAQKCGLHPSVPVIAGCGDQAAASLGAGIIKKGDVFDVSGTASVFSCCVDKYSPDIKNKTLVFPRSVIKGLWIPLAYISGGGLCLKWFQENFTGKNNLMSFAELDKEADEIPPGSGNLLFIPHFGGRTCPNNPDVKGMWNNLNWIHTRGHLFRSIMESIAYEYAIYIEIFKDLNKDIEFKKVVSIGGGAKSPVFTQIKADVLGIFHTTLNNSDSATLGSAVIAGFGVGLYEDISKTIDSMVVYENEYRPDYLNTKKYETYIANYKELLQMKGKPL